MVFKKEISIDGVAVITGMVILCAWLVTIKNKQDSQEATLANHSTELKEIHNVLIQEQLKNEVTSILSKRSDDHEDRLRVLEKEANFLRISGNK
jgi:uncharacterized protein YciI